MKPNKLFIALLAATVAVAGCGKPPKQKPDPYALTAKDNPDKILAECPDGVRPVNPLGLNYWGYWKAVKDCKQAIAIKKELLEKDASGATPER